MLPPVARWPFLAAVLSTAMLAVGCAKPVPAAKPAHADAPPTAPVLEGAWEGALDVGAIRLRLVLKLSRSGAGGAGWRATVDSLDQGAHDIVVDVVDVDDDKVTLTLFKLRGVYRARRNGDKLAGTWTQNGATLPLVLRKTSNPTGAKPRPQEPTGPLPYDEVEVGVANPAGHDQLACTLTKPRGPGRFGAVVLVTGSGPQNRDEALMGHRPFLVLADAITRKGVAVLRCDDRGFGKSTGNFRSATTFDFAGDVRAELATLRAFPDIDPAHVGLLGHSEGGIIAPMVAAKSTDVAFVVLLAGPGLAGEEILQLQSALIAKAMGRSDADITVDQQLAREVYAIIKAEENDEQATKKLRARYDALPEAKRRQFDSRGGSLDAQLKPMLSPWFRAFLTLDPRTYLAQVRVPVLALNGERDLQVPPRANLPELRKALNGNPDVTIRELPGLNHLLQTCKTGTPSEYGRIDETMAPAALTLVSDWIAAHAR